MSDLPIGMKVHELAERVAIDALSTDDTGFRLDCFKALSQFFIGMTRVSRQMRDEDNDVSVSVPQMRERIAAAGNGKA